MRTTKIRIEVTASDKLAVVAIHRRPWRRPSVTLQRGDGERVRLAVGDTLTLELNVNRSEGSP